MCASSVWWTSISNARRLCPQNSSNWNTKRISGGGEFTILRFSGGLLFLSSYQWLRIITVKCMHQNVVRSPVVTKICSHSLWCLNYIYFNLCVIYISAQSVQPCIRDFFFGDKQTQRIPPAYTAFNGTISVIWKIIKNVMGSAPESEIGTCYINARKLLSILVCAE